MEITRSIYSRGWAYPEDEQWYIPPRDPVFVDLTEICIPLDECITVTLGNVDPSVVEKLEHSRFDQAPVEISTAPAGWRLVATDHLKALLQQDRPLTSEEGNFLPNGTLGFESGNRSVLVEDLVGSMRSRRAAIVYCDDIQRHIGDDNEIEREVCQRIVYGLLTIADLNAQALRAAIYDRLSKLEIMIARLVSRSFSDSMEWICKLNEDIQVRILGYQALAKSRGADPNPVEAATLVDLIRVLANSPQLLSPLDYVTRKRFERDTGKIANIRNRVMHPVRPLVLNAEDVDLLANSLESVDVLRRRIEGAMRRPIPGGP